VGIVGIKGLKKLVICCQCC